MTHNPESVSRSIQSAAVAANETHFPDCDAGPKHVHDVSCSFGNPQCPLFGEQQEKPKRPLRKRIWFYRPQWYWHGWKTLIPFYTGGDEWDWHTICLGWTVTGKVVFATRRCPQTGRCADNSNPELAPDWGQPGAAPWRHTTSGACEWRSHSYPEGDEPCDCEARLAKVVTHTRVDDPDIGPPFCSECSEAVSEWVPWASERHERRVTTSGLG